MAGGDLNQDGFDDLIVGVPGEDVVGTSDGGAVNVIYGSATGLTAAGNQFWSQDSTDIADTAEVSDVFGFSVASADLNGDGFADMVAGVPGEDVGSIADAGAANVIYGSAAGLTATGNQFWNQDSADIKDAAELGDQFGFAVAAGDFDGDGYADLGAGVPFENTGTTVDGGAVSVIYGAAAGLSAAGNQYWSQNITGILDTAEKGDAFGFSVGVGDFDGNGRADLAAGVPGEDLSPSPVDAGAANVIYGTINGLAATGNQFWNQNSTGIADTAEAGDQLGYTVAVGDFGHGTQDDLVLAVPFENIQSIVDGGAVNVIYGSPTRLNASGNRYWSQNITGILDQSEPYDEFGFGLSFGPGSFPARLPGRRSG